MSNPLIKSQFKTNKYHAVKQEYAGGRYDSGKEARHAKTLDTLRRAASPAQRVVKVERQVKYSFDYNRVHIANWYADFRVTFADGHIEVHEVKGIKTDVYRMKEKMFLAWYPTETLIIF